MSRWIEPNYAQGWVFPPTLEELVPPEHPARFIRDFVAALPWETLGIPPPAPSAPGRPAYSPALLLGVWLYGYLQGIRSSRRLEQACYDHLGCLWLAGMQHPDHHTLARFLRAHRPRLARVLSWAVQAAARCGLVGLTLHALDGTRLPMAAAPGGAWSRARLRRQQAQLQAALDAVLAEVEATDAVESGETTVPPALQDVAARQAAIADALAVLAAADTPALHPGEPEARLQRLPGGTLALGYNAQAVVDQASGLVVAADVTASATDVGQLAPQVQQAAATLGAPAAVTVADAGYAGGAAIAAAEAAGCPVLVALGGTPSAPTGPYHAAHFRYDAATDTVRCPQGHALAAVGTRVDPRRGYTVRVFRCARRDCPVRAQCTRGRAPRQIGLTPHAATLAAQRARQATPAGRALLGARAGIIERVFAWVKQTQGFRRWTVRGLAGVRAQWALLCLTWNLRQLHRAWQAGRFTWTPA